MVILDQSNNKPNQGGKTMTPLQIQIKLLKLGISQREIARALGKTDAAISYVIRGKRNSRQIKSFIETICQTGSLPPMQKAA